MSQTVPRAFFDQPAPEVAKQLLGKILVRNLDGTQLKGRIVETEAYLSQNDPAAHSFAGRTARTAVIFEESGHAYVHAMRQYFCLDVVAEKEGSPGAVLIRALEPLEGLEQMRANRNTTDLHNLCSGPGKLCQALAIDRTLNGIDLYNDQSPLFIIEGEAPKHIQTSQRIGITQAKEPLLRFFETDSPFVSHKKSASQGEADDT